MQNSTTNTPLKFGLVIAVYNAIDYLSQCIDSWVDFRQKYGNLKIAIVDCKFDDFEDTSLSNNSNDGTCELLNQYLKKNKIDFFEKLPSKKKEHDARNVALNFLLKEKVDYIITWGVDEFASLEEIEKITNFVEQNPAECCFTINYKNYIFDDRHWADGFCPYRIWKTIHYILKLESFYWDDDCVYIDVISGDKVCDKMLPLCKIPKDIAHIKHHTWDNLQRNIIKILYQQKHFKSGAGCFLKYNEKENKVEWNLEYFKKTNQNIPQLFED